MSPITSIQLVNSRSPSRHTSETFHPALRFTDAFYLSEVVRHLRYERRRLGLSVSQVARRAGLKRSLIDQAEQDGYIPCSRDFKAWSLSLGIAWEDLWSLCCPRLMEVAV